MRPAQWKQLLHGWQHSNRTCISIWQPCVQHVLLLCKHRVESLSSWNSFSFSCSYHSFRFYYLITSLCAGIRVKVSVWGQTDPTHSLNTKTRNTKEEFWSCNHHCTPLHHFNQIYFLFLFFCTGRHAHFWDLSTLFVCPGLAYCILIFCNCIQSCYFHLNIFDNSWMSLLGFPLTRFSKR